MRSLAGLVIAAGLLVGQASTANAQITFSFGSPYGYSSYGSYGVGPFGYGSYGYGGYGLGSYGYGGYGLNSYGYGAGLPFAGSSYYNSGYSSAYVAPGTTSFSSGYYAPTPYGYGYGGGYGYPVYGGVGGYGLRSGYVATSPFMGLPRPFGGLVRVPR